MPESTSPQLPDFLRAQVPSEFDPWLRPRTFLPLKCLKLFKVLRWARDSDNPGAGQPDSLEPTESLDDADIVTSQYKDLAGEERHMIVLDLDCPVALIPSTTWGHSHLYIDMPMSWEKYKAILDALADAEVVERGYAEASKRRGFTCVRLPWVAKG